MIRVTKVELLKNATPPTRKGRSAADDGDNIGPRWGQVWQSGAQVGAGCAHVGLLGCSWEPLGGLLGPLGSLLGASWGPLGSLLGALGGLLGPLGVSWGLLGNIALRRQISASSWKRLGSDLGPSRDRLGPPWGPPWARLGASWGLLGRSWGPLGTSWGPLGAVLRSSWAS